MTQWTLVQTALSSGTTTFPANVGNPACYSSSERQILIKTSVSNNNSGGAYTGAPAFLFIQKRISTAPAVGQIN